MAKISFKITQEIFDSLRPDIRALFPNKTATVGSLLSTSQKTIKGEKYGFLSGILYLSPASTVSRSLNLCPHSTKECRKACIAWTGQPGMPVGRRAAIVRTILFLQDKPRFYERLNNEILSLARKAATKELVPAIRLNGTSDVTWEGAEADYFLLKALTRFPTVRFYDYTKVPERCTPEHLAMVRCFGDYHLTFSFSGRRLPTTIDQAVSIAVPFIGQLPERFLNRPVINGDTHDLRFLDEPGVVVGLSYKRPFDYNGGTVAASSVLKFVQIGG